MITRFIRADDFVGPDDLSTLQEVFDDLCRECLLSHHSAAADELARQIIQFYKAGARDREKLKATVCPRLRRPTG
jgi:Zn-finger protein